MHLQFYYSTDEWQPFVEHNGQEKEQKKKKKKKKKRKNKDTTTR
jgi:hypothetical protein